MSQISQLEITPKVLEDVYLLAHKGHHKLAIAVDDVRVLHHDFLRTVIAECSSLT